MLHDALGGSRVLLVGKLRRRRKRGSGRRYVLKLRRVLYRLWGGFLYRLVCPFRRLGGCGLLRLLHALLFPSCGLLLWSGKIRVFFPVAHALGGFFGFVYLDKPVAGHFLRDFITRLILSYGSTPPIRAPARAQYSLLISMPI